MPVRDELDLAIAQFKNLGLDLEENTARQTALLIAYDLCEQESIGQEFELSDKATQLKLIERWGDIIAKALSVSTSNTTIPLDSQSTKNNVEHRCNLRVLLRINMHMELLVGKTHYIGRTENISVRGALLYVDNIPTQSFVLNEEGKLWLELDEDYFVEFSCQVIHVSKRKIGIHFIHQDKNAQTVLRQHIEEKL